MKKLINFIFVFLLTLTFVLPVSAVTKVPVLKKSVVKKAVVVVPKIKAKVVLKKTPVVKVVKVVKPKIPSTQGLIQSINYDEKLFVMTVGEDTYTVSTSAKTKLYVPKIKKSLTIYTLSPEMVVKVAGLVDNEQKVINAQTINVVPVKTK